MFRLSKGAEYAIRGMLYLSMQKEGKVSFIEEISEAQAVPKAYLAKIFQALKKKGYLNSSRGQGGGFTLTAKPKDVTVIEVIEAMEGPVHLNDCLIQNGYCARDSFCPVHDLWQEAQGSFMDVLRNCTFEELALSGREKARLLKQRAGNL